MNNDFSGVMLDYISANNAAKKTGYSSDYISQLCRSGKIPSRMIGRGWFVDLSALINHKKNRQLGRPERIRESTYIKNKTKISYEIDSRPLLPQLNKAHAQKMKKGVDSMKFKAMMWLFLLSITAYTSYLVNEFFASSDLVAGVMAATQFSIKSIEGIIIGLEVLK